MVARTEQKARLLDLVAEVLDLTREDRRNVDDVSSVLQVIKDDPNFAKKLLARRWSIWKTCQVGGKNADQLVHEIEQANCKISHWARDMMKQEGFKTSPESQYVDFVKIKVRDLGFTENPTTDELYARAQAQGLEPCLLEDGPTMRANYLDQQKGEILWMAMEQIADSDGRPSIFGLHRDGGGLWLLGRIAGPGNHWYLVYEFVFRLSKKSS